MTVVTRFAPSPTGYLHIGGARTALFNWLFSRHHGGKFLLRIEDTDRERSTEDAVRVILEGLRWLELDWDEEPIFQFSRAARHAEVARGLLAQGNAYHCYATPEELAAMREKARAEGRSPRYDGRWRDRDPKEAPAGAKPAIRFKAPQTGTTVVDDLVQGRVEVANAELDDMVLLRADGTPTYMLSVVVDDHDMGVTHAIRGDDHLTNAFRQTQLFLACGWQPPRYAHIPLIHGADGAKLSKRHGAVALDAYAALGILPEAMRNYLLRLGWSHGDDEIISTEQAIEWFDLDAVGRSPARFDMEKLLSLNAHYIKEVDAARLIAPVRRRIENTLGRELSAEEPARLDAVLPGLRPRARSLNEIADGAMFLFRSRPLALDPKAASLMNDDSRRLLRGLAGVLGGLPAWDAAALEGAVRGYAEQAGVKLGAAAQPLRAALTGATVSPGIFDVMAALGREETLGRINDLADAAKPS
ncbi:MAG: glutamate--tRNA ligase [Alphaproteobacteria bacterium]